METEGRTEDLAQLLKRLKAEYQVNESEIARRINVHVSTVNNWVNRKRAGKRGPHRDKLKALAEQFPKFTEQEIFAAAGRQMPGDLPPEAEERLLELFKELTPQQQEMKEIEMKALRDANQS